METGLHSDPHYDYDDDDCTPEEEELIYELTTLLYGKPNLSEDLPHEKLFRDLVTLIKTQKEQIADLKAQWHGERR